MLNRSELFPGEGCVETHSWSFLTAFARSPPPAVPTSQAEQRQVRLLFRLISSGQMPRVYTKVVSTLL